MAGAHVQGYYAAGTVEYADYTYLQTSVVVNPPDNIDVADAQAEMPIEIRRSADISGPTSAVPGDWVTVTASPSSFDSTPAYSWTMNGWDMGSNSSSVSTQLMDPGDYTFAVTVYASVEIARNQLTVHVAYPDCPDCMGPAAAPRVLPLRNGTVASGTPDVPSRAPRSVREVPRKR